MDMIRENNVGAGESLLSRNNKETPHETITLIRKKESGSSGTMAKLSSGEDNDNSATSNVVSFDIAVSRTGYGLFHMIILFVSGGCLMCAIIETMAMMIIIPAAQCDLNLTLSTKGILSSVSFLGVVCSSHMWGYLADTKGRRPTLLISLVCASVISIIGSLIPWSWLFIVSRFANGFFISAASSVCYVYAGEFHDNRFRPKALTWMATFVAIGMVILPGFAWLILPLEFRYEIPFLNLTYRPWRLLLMLYTLPCLAFALFLFMLPESPKYLFAQGRGAEGLRVLELVYAFNKGKNKRYNVKEVIWEELGDTTRKHVGMLRSMWQQTAPLFRRGLVLNTLMMCFVQFANFANNAGIAMWYPEILNRMSHFIIDNPDKDITLCNAVLYLPTVNNSSIVSNSSNFTATTTTSTVCRDVVRTDVFLVSLVIGVAYAFMYILIGTIINMTGKKPLMIGFVVVFTVLGVCSQFVSGYSLIQFLVGSFLMCGTGIAIANAIAVELFPTQLRGMALAIAFMFGRLGAMTGTNVIGPIIFNFCDYLFYFIAALQALLILVVIMLPSQPKLQKIPQ